MMTLVTAFTRCVLVLFSGYQGFYVLWKLKENIVVSSMTCFWFWLRKKVYNDGVKQLLFECFFFLNIWDTWGFRFKDWTSLNISASCKSLRGVKKDMCGQRLCVCVFLCVRHAVTCSECVPIATLFVLSDSLFQPKQAKRHLIFRVWYARQRRYEMSGVCVQIIWCVSVCVRVWGAIRVFVLDFFIFSFTLFRPHVSL